MREYLNQIKGCVDILNASGYKVKQEDHILYIMSCLGSEYNPVMVSVSSKMDPITSQELSSLLLSFEARLENNVSSKFSNEGSSPSANLTTQQPDINFRGRGSNTGGNRGGIAPLKVGYDNH